MHLVVQVNNMTVEEEIVLFKSLTDKMNDIFKKKRSDYGPSTSETYDKFGPVSMLIRMYDKLSRLDNLLVKSKENKVDESVDDTLLDLANYALITLLELQKRRLENENKDRRLNT